MKDVKQPYGFFILPLIYTFFVWAPFYGIYHWIILQNDPYGLISTWNILWIPIVLVLMLALNNAYLELVVEKMINFSNASIFLLSVIPITTGILVLSFPENFQSIWIYIIPDLKDSVILSDFKLYNNPPIQGVGFILIQILLAMYIISSIVLPLKKCN